MDKVNKATKLPVNSIDDLKAIGQILSTSKMLGAINPAQGFVIACICHQTGISYNEYGETYHILGSTPSMRADTMLANMVTLGGEYEMLERTPTCASIRCKYGITEGTFTFTAEEAYAEPIAYKGGPKDQARELKKPFASRNLKDKYSTPRSLMQMLWARVLSDAVRTVCPKANKGTYTPEEVEDFDHSDAAPQSSEPTKPTPVVFTADRCPIPGKMLGKLWSDMDGTFLKAALDNLDKYKLTEEHRAEIEKAAKATEESK